MTNVPKEIARLRAAERVEGKSTVDLIVVRERLRREVGER